MQQSFTIVRLLVCCLLLLAGMGLTKPVAAQGYTDNGKRYIMYTLYHYGDADGTMQQRQIQGMEDAFSQGFNSVVIGIAWDVLQPSLNSPPNWAYIDRFIAVAQRYNAKIAIRIKTGRRDRVGFWPEEQSMKDTRGKTMDQEGGGHVRLGYTPAIDKVQDFARSVAQRYKYLNDRGELLFMSVTFNPQWENEYWYTNYPDQYKTTYDFNELTIGDFQRWALAKYGGSLQALNLAWGSSYATVSDIRPTYPNINNEGGFLGKRGADWYAFRHIQLKNFNDRFARTVKSVDPTIRIITEQGSVFDSANRGTLGFKNLSELYDGIKVNDGPGFIYQFSMDLLRSNVKPGGWIINEIDGLFFRDPSSTALLATQIEDSFKYGAKIITFANYFPNYNQETQLRQLTDGIKAKRLLEQPVPTLTPVGTMTYKLSSVVQGGMYESGIFSQWNTMRGSNQSPVRILINEDLLETGALPTQNQAPTVANRVPGQTAIINSAFSFKIPANTFADADGQIVSVAVSGLPVGLNYNPATGTISGTPTLIGSSEVSATATDNNNATVTEYFVLVVKRATLPLQLLDPILDCNTGRFEFRSTEGDGSAVEYALDNVIGWGTQTVYTLSDQLRSGSILTLRARQSGIEQTLRYTTPCSATTTNKPPVVNGVVADQTAKVGTPFSVSVPASLFSDPDGTIASVAVSGLPAGLAYNSATRFIQGTASTAGLSTVTITATDDKGATVSTTFKLTIDAVSGIRPLRLLDPLIDCATNRFEFRSVDGDGTPIEYAADELFSYSTQSVYISTTPFRAGGVLTLRARQNGVAIQFLYTTPCSSGNRSPVVSQPLADQRGIVNRGVSVLVPAGTFTDADGTIASVSVSGLPPGLSYNSATRLLTGTVATAGSWVVTVTATDDRGATVSTTFSFIISPDGQALRLLDPVLNCDTGLFEFRSAGGDGSPIEYSIDRLIDWSTNATFTLADNMRRTGQLDIKARQGGQLAFGVFYPACPLANQLPTVRTPIQAQALTQFRNMTLVIPAGTFADADGTIASVSLSGLPPGLTYTTNTSLVSGAPTTPGTWTVTATATDNRGGSVSTTFVITVEALTGTGVLRLLDPVLNCDTGLFEFRSAGGDGSPIEYSIDRLIDWSTNATFTLADNMRRTGQLDIKARQGGQLAFGVFYPACPLANQLPTVRTPIQAQALTQFRNMTLVIPAGTFADADGTIASVSLSGLPPGLTYTTNTSLVSGAPTTPGTWTVTATATDNRGGSVSTTFVITVTAQAKALRLLVPLLDCVTGRLEFQTVDGDGSAIGYSIDQLLDWSNQPIYTLADGPRHGTVIVLRVRQSGTEQTLTYTTPCIRPAKPLVVTKPMTDLVLIVNQPASVTLPASLFTDPDGGPISVALTGLPVGLSYEPSQRIIQGTPTLIGTSPAIARASANGRISVSDTFLITIRTAPRFAVTTTLLDLQGRLLKDLVDGDLLDIKRMPVLVNLSCQPKMTAGSVLMELTGKARRTVYANAAPYLLYPSGQGFKPEIGSYQLKMSVFSGANGTGTLLGVTTIRFDIVVPNEGG